jgi:hypothetical protein
MRVQTMVIVRLEGRRVLIYRNFGRQSRGPVAQNNNPAIAGGVPELSKSGRRALRAP